MLVVDDDENFLQVLADLVRESGRPVFTARGSAEAFQILDSPALPGPCLILLDWVMEPSSGSDFLEKLHARGKRDTIVAIMSGDPRVHSIPDVREAVGFLRKPFKLTELHALLDRYC